MSIDKTPAVVLKTFDFRETSRIATFFTKEFGKVKGLLKGIRKDPKKFGSPLNLGSLNEIVFYRKRSSDLHLISHCDLQKDFAQIRKDLKRAVTLNYILELADALTPVEDKNKLLFELLVSALVSLEAETDTPKLLHIFQIKTLALSGFKPHFDSCLICDKKIAATAFFSHKLGGLLCLNCRSRDLDSRAVLKGTIATIKHIEQEEWEGALRLGLNSTVRLELSEILQDFLHFHVERRMKSAELLGL
ncbi:MAG: DNA repair protein RecO [Candidatus Omnitrophota bacterium]